MSKRDALSAVLVAGDLRDNLRGDVAGGGETVRLLNHGSGNPGSVLQHVLKVDEVAVVHVLGVVIHIVEMDDALFMRGDNILGKEQTGGDVLGYLARHVVALNAVDRRVLVGVFLLDFFVVAFDEGEDLIVGRIRLTHQTAGIAVRDVLLGDFESAFLHDSGFDNVLNLFDGKRAIKSLADSGGMFGNGIDLLSSQRILERHGLVGFRDCGTDLLYVKFLFLSTSF